MYSISFTVTNKKFCLSLHYSGVNSYLFVNGKEIYKFKAKDSEILVGPVCLGNISEDWSVDNMERAGFTGYVYDFSVDYEVITVDDIKNIHKYLMKKKMILYEYIKCNKENVSIYDFYHAKKNINHTCTKYTSCFTTYKMGVIKQISIKN